MGTEHVIHLFRRDTRAFQSVEIRLVQLMEVRRRRALFVIAAAGINQNGVMRRAD